MTFENTGTLGKISGLARIAFRDLIRERVLYSGVLGAVALLALMFFVSQLTFERPDRVVLSLGMLVLRLGMIATAVLLASGLVNREFSRGTALVILSKPVSRLEMMLGLYLGLAAVLLLNWLILCAGLLGTLFLVGGAPGALLGLALLAAFAESVVMAGIALVFSTFSSVAVSVTLSVGVLLIGSNVSQLRFLGAKSDGLVSLVFSAVAWMVPNLERFQLTENVVYSIPVSAAFTAGLAGYAAIWSAILVGTGAWILARRKV